MPDTANIPKIQADGFVSKSVDPKKVRLEMGPPRADIVSPWQNTAPAWPQKTYARQTIKAAPGVAKKPAGSMGKRSDYDKAEEDRKATALMIKLGVCAAVCVLALGLRLINTPTTVQLAQDVRQVITTEIDVDETIGKLKFVDGEAVADDGAAMVFGSLNVTLPVQGEVREQFGENGSSGVVFACTQGAAGVACADGVVEALGMDETRGQYVRLRHAAGLETFLYGLAEVAVEQGQPLKSGDILGKSAGDSLYFEARVNGAPQDPLALYEAAKG